ncbi:MAG: MBL fold metallo-hydrolase [Rhodospirillaceae bacterium]|jgi:glyoxylase-like metal-dependent hydrolase (beta-lactamase superfamily II)|nr:MBL fold metallo-hydrolase [Rhodospirillaceae bacterium]MBT4045528.1 MBL fold metallo-hydrolase [Rhodospirillaceae bacterium]MBT4688080.1 MBL fold metallo-hydrolase [Rhodospirillaceae bacterium]MBT5081744.1 MBL fold metallo-hydrolase [Rhodospirillaceae bacterium]MBT5527394.1 MBL fold metallo-hydrolase [Rhodospirillaceae bacterium]
MFNIGNIKVSRVVESEGPFAPIDVFFPDVEREVIEANRDWLMPRFIDPATEMIILNIQSYVLRTAHHTILVDTCVGNHKERPGRASFHQLNLPYLADLAAAGVQPEDVDFVMCTHLHIDHVGWNTKLVDGRWVPTFPNAKYIFGRTEYEFWEQRHIDGTQGPVPNVYDDSVLPVMEAGQAVLVDMDHQIDDNMWFEPAPGHTAGNMILHLQAGDDRAVLSGDVMHHPLQLIRPEWSSRACEDPVQSTVTRRALIERYADTDTLIAPAHFASPTAGHIIRRGDAFAFRLLGEE